MKKIKSNRYLKSILTLLLLLNSFVPNAQTASLNYQIFRNNTGIGWLRLEKKHSDNKMEIVLISEVKTRLLLPLSVSTKETSTFENGKLLYSSQFRKTNGSINTDIQTKLVSNRYEMLNNGKKVNLPIETIDSNLLSLYFLEPQMLNKVYCEKLQLFIQPIKTSDGGYKLNFPNGNSNCYYYKEGICTKIRVKHQLYVIDIVFNPN